MPGCRLLARGSALILLGLWIAVPSVHAEPPKEGEKLPVLISKAASDAGIHSLWDRLTRTYVKNGVVRYDGFQKHEALLDDYLGILAKTKPASLSEKHRMAFLINAYNAFTVKLILTRYPKIKSIKDIPSRWTVKKWKMGGRMVSLDDIEHGILRKKYQEPRIHFAVNCASISCPDLRSEAFVAPRLEAQLDDQTRRFLLDTTRGFRAAREPGTFWGYNNNVYLSKIFSWFGGDFQRNGTSLVDFLKPFLSADGKAFITRHEDDLSLRYLDYDWTLNGR